jgi:transcriptional regulator with XRE-family HTH domain
MGASAKLDREIIGHRMGAFRKDLRLWQKDLGLATSLPREWISKLEKAKHKNMTLDLLANVANALGVPVDALRTEDVNASLFYLGLLVHRVTTQNESSSSSGVQSVSPQLLNQKIAAAIQALRSNATTSDAARAERDRWRLAHELEDLLPAVMSYLRANPYKTTREILQLEQGLIDLGNEILDRCSQEFTNARKMMREEGRARHRSS